ncbi:polymorphic toxin-type HINT domain-containing protein [Catellatospora sichuanensis]|uniref:polymorphic toxin-type HINT domain-containing protein n=1 Tax=Catellatospora sichuanensis TaxID=1969805 RepID=UPI001642B3E6|nr:polymorphic toxin-type HINT domain-containing protein [Catellatospora sichuanensis]
MIAALTALVLLTSFVKAPAAEAAEDQVFADRSLVVSAWRAGGPQVRAAAEKALLGSDSQISAFLTDSWLQAERLDRRDGIANAMNDSGPSLRATARAALAADAAGDPDALSTFLTSGWQGPADIDTRVSVNQLMAAGGDQVRQVAQTALDAGNPQGLRTFLESGWQVQWNTDQRLRINQAMATGGPQVRAAGQKALDAGTPEALEAFLAYEWAVTSARDDETATIANLLAQAQAAGELAAVETRQATAQAEKAREAADAARASADEAAAATEAAQGNAEEAEVQAQRAATAAEHAAAAAEVAIESAAAATRAARTAATAAARAASLAAKAGRAAAIAHRAAAWASTDASKAADARRAADEANALAAQARDISAKADQAGKAIQAGLQAVQAAKAAASYAKLAAVANDLAVRHANAAGAQAKAAIAAAARARALADRALAAAQAAEAYLNVAIDAAFKARDAALRAAANAEAAARAAIEAAEHAGEAGQAAQRATENANAATVAAQAAVDAAIQATGVFQAARTADAARLAAARDSVLDNVRAANVEYEAQLRQADWDADQAAKRDAATNQLLAVAQNPATPRPDAVVAARQVALNLAVVQSAWTQQAGLAALSGTDDQVLQFARTGVAVAAALDNRQAVANLAVTENAALSTAAITALTGSDTAVATFLRTQNYPGRYTQDRMKVNQILASAHTAGDVVLAQKAQEALNAETLPALRDFLDTGQYTAAAIGQRVMVNQIFAHPDSGPEVKAAAQIALDGPPPGLRLFLSTGRYTAAARDHEASVHLAIVGGLLQKTNEVAELAVQNALEAQAMAAQARDDAQAAGAYAQQALDSANRAAGYAAEAALHANSAATSVDKAAAAVQTARTAATRANASANAAVRSAVWAISSHGKAVDAAKEAHASATLAYESAIAAGQNAEAAMAAATQAYGLYEAARVQQLYSCANGYVEPPTAGWEELLGTQSEWSKVCAANYIADPAELATRAYTNAAYCTPFPVGSQFYQNCIHSVLDPNFLGMQKMTLITEGVKAATALLLVAGAGAGIACVLTVVCGTVAGILLTIGEVSIEVFSFVQGDQTLAQTLLNLGTIALEALVLAGIGKLLSVGFTAVKAAYLSAQAGKKAQAQLEALNLVRMRLNGLSLCDHSFDPTTLVVMADESRRSISEVRVGDLVRTTDPATGHTTSKPVTHVWRNIDTDLAEVDVSNGAGDVSTVRTTSTHPFLDVTSNEWTDAADLGTGHRLHALDGATATVTAVRAYGGTAVMHDLSVADTHTYYVVAGRTPILVHNTGPGCGSLWMSASALPHHYMRPSDAGIMHAEDFGVIGPFNKANGELFIRAIEHLVKHPDTIRITGRWRNSIDAVHYVNPHTGLHASFVAHGPNVGEYLGGWKSEGAQLHYLLTYGVL